MKKSILQGLFRGQRRRIFISYRRHGDGSGYGGRLADSLMKHFGRDQCYLDVEHVDPGFDFVKSIEEGIAACEVLIVVIGPDWITQKDCDGNPRLENPNDWVRVETATALQRDIRVIPVLVGGAQLPREEQLPDDLKNLCRRQAHELSDSRWMHDVGKLLDSIEKIGIRGRRSPEQIAFWKRLKTGAGILAPILAGLLVFYVMKGLQKRSTVPDQPPLTTQVDINTLDSLQSELQIEQETRRKLEAEREQAQLEVQLQNERAKRREAERAKKELQDRVLEEQPVSERIMRPLNKPPEVTHIYFTITDMIGVDEYGYGQIAESVIIDIDGNKENIVLSVMNGKTSGSVRFKLPEKGFYDYEVRTVTLFNDHNNYGESCTHMGYGSDRLFIEDGQVFALVMDPRTLDDPRYRVWLEPVEHQ